MGEGRKMGAWRIGEWEWLTFRSIHFRTVFCISFLTLIATSCYEPREGCLDLRATNFAVDADDPCADCCSYPVLRLALSHKVYDAPLDTFFNLVYLDSVYQDGLGNDFRIQNIQFYISNLRLVRADGTEVPTQDSLSIEIIRPDGSTEEVNMLNNVALVNRRTFSEYEMGTLITEGAFERIRFEVGLTIPANQSSPEGFPAEHPLATDDMYVNADTGFIFNQLDWLNGSGIEDTTVNRLNIASEANLRTVDLPLPVSLIEGFNIIVTLRVDYAAWFSGVNLRNDNPATLATKISNNLTNSFTVLAVDLE